MMPRNTINDLVRLPAPRRVGTVSLEAALDGRRSVREFRLEPMALASLSQLLWACQGPIGDGRRRAAPSAGGTYPLSIVVAAGNVADLPAGLYRYDSDGHALYRIVEGDFRRELYGATVGQMAAASAPVSLMVSAVYDRTTARYGTRGMAYALIEAGHAGQNLYLQATALGLGTTAIGAFREDVVRMVLHLDPQEHPVYLFPVGTPAG
jgi:SagB-type dehydrogenase family enzyme